ncbi:Zinc finger, RING-type [Corchorus olitorius]|uniref:RING-type E3 ubiquitin transferase n=1 Tax=Corchorus olitorius TaxID=93759 RepID=A0A1R3GK81_9ROSI|nr:Zinc finger, RING-type [Corchorus olitorius]
MAATNNEGFSRVLKIDMTEVQKSSSTSITDLSKFEIEVHATFIIMQKYGGVEDDMFAEEGRFYSQVMYEFSREYLIGGGYGAVLNMLKSQLRVPIEPAIVEKLAAQAVTLATTSPDGGDCVSGMKVEIVAVVSSLPDFTNNDDDSDVDDEEDEGTEEEEEEDMDVDAEEDEGLMTAEEVAEKVGNVVVEASGKDCSICLGELTVGSEAACMPCSHVFHRPCILTWLNRVKRCPYCRFDMNLTV